MNAEQFSEFRHEAIHELMNLNDRCEREFSISACPRWDYDFDRGTLTFSRDGVARVIASILVVGTTSETSATWLWSWANSHLPPGVTEAMKKVRSFGEAEGVAELTNPSAPDDEYLGWGLTAIAAKIIVVPQTTASSILSTSTLALPKRHEFRMAGSNLSAVHMASAIRPMSANTWSLLLCKPGFRMIPMTRTNGPMPGALPAMLS